MNKVTISDFLLAVSDLIEAQSAQLQQSWADFFEKEREKSTKFFLKISLIVVFSFLLLSGFISFCIATYMMLLSRFMPEYAAIYIISGLFFVFALITFLKVKNDTKRG